jgi:hypothetical protein
LFSAAFDPRNMPKDVVLRHARIVVIQSITAGNAVGPLRSLFAAEEAMKHKLVAARAKDNVVSMHFVKIGTPNRQYVTGENGRNHAGAEGANAQFAEISKYL